MTVILHIGFPKTATTSLQRVFSDNRDAFSDKGLLYPIVDSDFKQRYLKAFLSKPGATELKINSAIKKKLNDVKQLVAANPGKHVLLSCEELTNSQSFDVRAPLLNELRKYLRSLSQDIRVVSYVREPSAYYLSRMQEHVKSAGGIVPPEQFKPDFAHSIEQYEKALNAQSIVRPFERDQLIGGGILSDFLHQISDLVNIDPAAFDEPKTNESLPAEAMFVLDIARQSPKAIGKGVSYDSPQSQHFWRQIQRISKQVGAIQKPILFESAARKAEMAASDDLHILKSKYGITFQPYKSLAEPAPTDPLTSVETILPVNRQQALAIWGIFTHRANKAMMP
ncbi:hypothetical protein Q4578_17970 [Shimia thalassica]|uniref:hypothetical protein n=1 Tax=Shimia thalassica TaxID=1715693 RepID=UPI0026E439F0|nr:hypothetical protein [Shimia thalassica]MDO6523487.1 hypothetical protein [Shimia thalassica]